VSRFLRHLVPAAEAERAARVRDYPAFVAKGFIRPQDAEADIAAWTAIAVWLSGRWPEEKLRLDDETLKRWDPERAAAAARGEPVRPLQGRWEVMLLAAAKALRHIDALRARSPDDEELAARRARLAAIHGGIEARRRWLEDRALFEATRSIAERAA
jgi:hypothetical protein